MLAFIAPDLWPPNISDVKQMDYTTKFGDRYRNLCSASEMTYIVSGGALNFTYSLTCRNLCARHLSTMQVT